MVRLRINRNDSLVVLMVELYHCFAPVSRAFLKKTQKIRLDACASGHSGQPLGGKADI